MDTVKESSKALPAMAEKRVSKKAKPSDEKGKKSKPHGSKKAKPAHENPNFISALQEPSTTPPLTDQRNAAKTKKKKLKKKKKSSGVSDSKIEPITKAPTSENPIATAESPQIPSGSAGRAKIAKNLAHVFKAQQKLVNRYRTRKNFEERKCFPFLNLPQELRDIIISYTINYDGIDAKLFKINESFPSKSLRKPSFPDIYQGWMSNLEARCVCTTPTILLLNQQIHEEAQEILQKKALRIANPPQYPIPNQFDLSRVISNGAFEKVCKIKFELHTYPAKVRKPNNLRDDWRGKDLLKDERLADSYPWAMLLKDCFELWRSAQQSLSLEISIGHCSGSRSVYNLSVSGEKIWAFEKCIDEILLSLDLDALVAFLTFAHVPIEFE